MNLPTPPAAGLLCIACGKSCGSCLYVKASDRVEFNPCGCVLTSSEMSDRGLNQLLLTLKVRNSLKRLGDHG